MKRACANCRFFLSSGFQVNEYRPGECRRNAPHASHGSINAKYGVRQKWPEVDADDWCGEFAAKEDASV